MTPLILDLMIAIGALAAAVVAIGVVWCLISLAMILRDWRSSRRAER